MESTKISVKPSNLKTLIFSKGRLEIGRMKME